MNYSGRYDTMNKIAFDIKYPPIRYCEYDGTPVRRSIEAFTDTSDQTNPYYWRRINVISYRCPECGNIVVLYQKATRLTKL